MPDILLITAVTVGFGLYVVAVATESNPKLEVIAAAIVSFTTHWLCAYVCTPTTYKDVAICKVHIIPDRGVQYIYYKNEIINLNKMLGSVVSQDYVTVKTPNKTYYGVTHVIKDKESASRSQNAVVVGYEE